MDSYKVLEACRLALLIYKQTLFAIAFFWGEGGGGGGGGGGGFW